MSKIVEGYPQAAGSSKREGIGWHYGPASYVQVTNGLPPTGGDTLNASEFGLKFLDWADVNASNNGQYSAYCIFGDATPSGSAPGTYPKRPTSVTLKWYVTATGAEVTAGTNLTAIALRCFGRGM